MQGDGVTFVADIDGESLLIGGSGDLMSNSATERNALPAGNYLSTRCIFKSYI